MAIIVLGKSLGLGNLASYSCFTDEQTGVLLWGKHIRVTEGASLVWDAVPMNDPGLSVVSVTGAASPAIPPSSYPEVSRKWREGCPSPKTAGGSHKHELIRVILSALSGRVWYK